MELRLALSSLYFLQTLGLEVEASISDQYENWLFFFFLFIFGVYMFFSEQRLNKDSSPDVYLYPYTNFILLINFI